MRRIFGALLRIAVGAIFVAAGVLKLRAPDAFSRVLVAYRLPRSAHRPLTWFVPGVEVGLGALLISGLRHVSALIAAAGLLVTFTVAAGVQLARGGDADCGCFGDRLAALSRGRRILARNIVLLTADLAALLLLRRN